LPSENLVRLLHSRNDWLARKVRRILADRRDLKVIPSLRKMIFESNDHHLALEALWALYVSGGFDENLALKLLDHLSPQIRLWTVRFIGDEFFVESQGKPRFQTAVARLIELAGTEADARVRRQLASTAKRLPPRDGLALAEKILQCNLDGKDPYIPLLLWWAVERHAITAVDQTLKIFTAPSAWETLLIRDFVLERLMRRWSAEGKPVTFDACAALLASAPDAGRQHRLLAAIEQGFHDRPMNGVMGFGTGGLFAQSEAAELHTNDARTSIEHVTPALAGKIALYWREDTTDAVLIHLAAHIGNPGALARARALVVDEKASAELRREMLHLLGDFGDTTDTKLLLAIVGSGAESLQLAALDALPSLGVAQLASELLKRYSGLSEPVRRRVRQILLSRKEWARAILGEVDSGRLPAADFSTEQLRIVALHEDGELNALVRKHWGRLSGGTPEEKLAEMRRLNNDLNAGSGNPARGHEVFMRVCGACHTMFGEGGKIGPDLTSANRADREFLLASIVDPSAAIRKEFLAYEVELTDGRALSGVIVDQSGGSLTLGTSTGERVTVPQSQITSVRESSISTMPESLAKLMKPQELRDLFTFLQSKHATGSKP
jgi:putative heme-binding domain-containing protein